MGFAAALPAWIRVRSIATMIPLSRMAGFSALLWAGWTVVWDARCADYRPPRKELGFPVYTNQPSGKQLSGQHAPASTPALSPEAAQAKFTVPEGFEIRLFASEPEVVNPVAMTWDERGRLWVVELYEYPLGSAKGEKGRDRIKVLEDTDADGRADRVHVWAEGFSLATGILLGNGGVYLGQAPHLLFLKDTDGDGRADHTEIVKTGFGLEDRHELLNGFTWGPDGAMYMTHGVFTRSEVKGARPEDGGEPVLLTAGVARWDVRQPARFEVYAEGTSNPWGVDFDARGNAFVSACVIEHLFHLAPGGIYDRQAGTEPHPYAYERLKAINDHKHHMAAYAGLQVYQGDSFPAENQGTILQGNIHDNAVHQDRLTPRGSSFVASHWRDLVRANDGWFMPVSTQVGPDGAVWIMDWYDRYPCYQNANADPAGVDREHGRIWRVVHTGGQRGKPVPSRPQRDMDLARLDTARLVELLAHPNAWQRRTAQRVLSERREAQVTPRLQALFDTGEAASPGTRLDARLAAFWTLFSAGFLSDDVLARAVRDPEPAIRLWAARFIGERQIAGPTTLDQLTALSADADPSVRLAVAVACRRFVSSQLTVNRPRTGAPLDITPVLAGLVASSADARDPVLPFMIWMAGEPGFAANPGRVLEWMSTQGAAAMPLSGVLAAKAMRRLCDAGGAESIDLAVGFIERVLPEHPEFAVFALEGLLKGQEGKALTPSGASGPFIAKLTGSRHAKVVELGQKLGAAWGDAAAQRAILSRALDASVPVAERVQAVQSARRMKNDATRDAMLQLLGAQVPEAVQMEAIAALGELGGDNVAEPLLGRWKNLSPAARQACASTLSSRRRWAMPLLAQVRLGAISPSEFGASVIRNLLQHKDDSIRAEAGAAIGKFRESPEDKAKLVVQKRAMVLEGEPDRAAGHEVATRVCLVCHKLHGEGAEVGPDLTGVGRSSLDALLWNVIDPNQVIGAGYEQVEVETRDDRVIAGRLVESTDTRVRLLLQGPKEEVVARSDIKGMRTLSNSVMPEGLEQLPDAEFRNLIWYILAPPQEGPLTREKKDALSRGVHEEGRRAAAGTAPEQPLDRESVALWSPGWKLTAPEFEGTPAKLTEYHGRRNVLRSHPFDGSRAAVLEREIAVAATGRTVLRVSVAAHDQGDWELRVLVRGEELVRRVVSHEGSGARWSDLEIDLSRFAGRTIPVRLENRANDWAWEFGYWADLRVDNEPLSSAR
ncbi:MAG: dehydrogenase [Verrucomicrobiales bacterium]|nr:dehydrogenase [Verrucomicrobiales bacterium]